MSLSLAWPASWLHLVYAMQKNKKKKRKRSKDSGSWPGYHHLDITTWISPLGYHHLDIITWISSLGYHHLDITTWISSLGYHHLDIITWISSLGYHHLDIITYEMATTISSHLPTDCLPTGILTAYSVQHQTRPDQTSANKKNK